MRGRAIHVRLRGVRWSYPFVLTLAACAAPTSVRVDVSLGGGEPVPTSLALSMFDPHRALVQAWSVPKPMLTLPGVFIIHVPDVSQELRIAIVGQDDQGR